ncbi:MAG: hypothetical protein RLZ04_425 [Actinomycetota bacterium]
MKRSMRSTLVGVAATAGFLFGGQPMVSAAPPVVATDDGAFVRIVGNPADGTAKFQFGWEADSPASDAVGYWLGVYDVTNSHYEWILDPEPRVEDLDELFRNAKPTVDLPNGEYKVVFFVRGTYGPATNLAEIELPFEVTNSDA